MPTLPASRNAKPDLILTPQAAHSADRAARRLHLPQRYGERGDDRVILEHVAARGEGEQIVKLAASRELFAYWRALRGARSAPERDDVDPGAIRGILADTFILEFDAQRDYPIRVVGTRTNALFLRELRGARFMELWREQDREEMHAILASVADEAQPFLIGAVGAPRSFASVDVEVLLLPLRHHGDTHARILGCCAPAAPPRWLGLAAVETLALLTLRAVAASEGAALEAKGAPGFARTHNFERRGHLFYSAGGRENETR
jgi:hypothetical protein